MRVAVFALAALMAACAAPAPAPAGDGSGLGDLANTSWVLITDAPQPPTLAFETDRASGFAGCNRWFASVGRTDQAMSFGDVGLTRMMCPEAQMAVETNFTAALGDTEGVRVEGDVLVLYDIGGSDTARFRRAP
jgi:heat shock protein HslJ